MALWADPAGVNTNFCPPMAADAISPPLLCVKTATPLFQTAVAWAPVSIAVTEAPAAKPSFCFRTARFPWPVSR